MTGEPMKDQELEATLTELGARLAYPRPTRLADAVRARLREPRTGRPWDALRSPRYAFVPLFATVLVLAVVIVAAVPGARAAADEFLRLRGIDIFRSSSAPATPSAGASAKFPGERVTLAEAQRRAPFLRVPTDARLGQPDEIYIDAAPRGERVTLVYAGRAGIAPSREAGVSAIIVAIRGRVDETFFGKVAGPGTRIEEVTVNGGRGFWLSGEPHLFFYRDAAGDPRQETLRLAGNTLLWEQDGTTLRIEAPLSREEALGIAATFR